MAQSGQPYSVYDFSGSVASLYYGSSDYITNPIVPLVPGVTAKQAQLQGTTGVNAGKPVLNAADFAPQFVAPGTNGVPACDASGCDNYESLFGSTGPQPVPRALPGAFRYDARPRSSCSGERYRLRFNFDAFNLFNHPDFDAPNNDVAFFPYYDGPPQFRRGQLGLHPAHHRQFALPATVAASVVLSGQSRLQAGSKNFSRGWWAVVGGWWASSGSGSIRLCGAGNSAATMGRPTKANLTHYTSSILRLPSFS